MSNKMKLLVTIVERGFGGQVIAACEEEHQSFNLSFLGRGTAQSRILEYLGLGESEKDIVMSFVPEDFTAPMLNKLNRKFELDNAGNGIAFTIPIKSVGGPITLGMLSGIYGEKADAT